MFCCSCSLSFSRTTTKLRWLPKKSGWDPHFFRGKVFASLKMRFGSEHYVLDADAIFGGQDNQSPNSNILFSTCYQAIWLVSLPTGVNSSWRVLCFALVLSYFLLLAKISFLIRLAFGTKYHDAFSSAIHSQSHMCDVGVERTIRWKCWISWKGFVGSISCNRFCPLLDLFGVRLHAWVDKVWGKHVISPLVCALV